MVTESIVGVTDAFGLATTITVTGIQQDEPVEAIGSGNYCARWLGRGHLHRQRTRRARSPGTGRIYFISFTATDTQGAQCSGMVAGIRSSRPGSRIHTGRHRTAIRFNCLGELIAQSKLSLPTAVASRQRSAGRGLQRAAPHCTEARVVGHVDAEL